jgi:hypothetical protein
MFIVPVKNLNAAGAEINGFLRGRRVPLAKKEFGADEEIGFRHELSRKPVAERVCLSGLTLNFEFLSR